MCGAHRRAPRAHADARCPATHAGRTALHNAAEYADEPVARALLSGGAAVDAKTLRGVTPSQMALARTDAGGAALLGLFTFWAADVEAAAAARLRIGGQGSRVLSSILNGNRSSHDGGGAAAHSSRGGGGGGSRSGYGGSYGGSHGGGSRSGASGSFGLSNHPMRQQHGSSAAMQLMGDGGGSSRGGGGGALMQPHSPAAVK
jgi:hypothetical protein